MKVQVTIEQDYCPLPHDCLGCMTGEFTYEADVPDSLIGPISEPVVLDDPWTPMCWASIRPIVKRDMLLEDLWLEAERQVAKSGTKKAWANLTRIHEVLTLMRDGYDPGTIAAYISAVSRAEE